MNKDDSLHAVLVEAYQVAGDMQELRALIVSANIALPQRAADLLVRLPGATRHLRDAIHDTRFDPDDETTQPRLAA